VNPDVVSISVAMATYNGAEYVTGQLASILEQLGPDDEVIIVDDHSTDGTVAAIRTLDDPRIAVHVNDRNRGDVFSFGRAISLAKNDVVFLSDQDDIWSPGRVELMTHRLLESGASVVTSNFDWMDTHGTPIVIPYDGVSSRDSAKHLRNIVDIFVGKTNYFGCAMAFRHRFLPVISPIPAFVESHDLWIALASNLAAANSHLDEVTLRKRKHANNATSTVSRRPIAQRLWSRVIFALSIPVLLYRLRAHQASG
jgi:glycosyltransferase involved in cell wall biosynthesis